MTPYLDELRVNWRPVAAAFIGMGGGLMTASYVMGIMAPYLIAEFGWERSQFALISGLGLISVLAFPIVGRLTDVIGVRRMALVGAVASPLLFLALSQLQDIRTYAILFTMQCLFLVTTTPPIYCRVVVQYIKRARGLALAIVTSGPALIVAIGGPILNNFVAAEGWRAGYLALVVFSIIVGAVAILLLPSARKGQPARVVRRTAKEDYARMVRAPAFWIIIGAVMLVSFPQSVMLTQLSLILEENGASGAAASAIISLFAAGTLVGRFLAGVALDRFPAPVVSTVGVLLSAVGLFIFASNLDARPMLMLAALLFGLTYGAEGDVVAYLVVRNFGVRIYSSVAGIMASMVAIAATICAITLSLMLDAFGQFAPFLVMSGVLVVVGSVLFLLLPFNPVAPDEAEEIADGSAPHESNIEGDAAKALA
jgi:predicted MFS family arabinose efflux permease